MGTSKRVTDKEDEKTTSFIDTNLKENFPTILRDNLKGIKEEIQKTNETIKIMLHGIHREVEEIKALAESNKILIENFIVKRTIKKTDDDIRPEIETGLDFLTKVPQHLRRTFETILKLDPKGVTAKEVAWETGKSRSLESDYLNQLSDRGLVYKKQEGKKVLFYTAESDLDEDEFNGIKSNKSNNFILSKKIEVAESNISTKKN
jgi:DNA-binding transcriptional ArsR family regulator